MENIWDIIIFFIKNKKHYNVNILCIPHSLFLKYSVFSILEVFHITSTSWYNRQNLFVLIKKNETILYKHYSCNIIESIYGI